MQELAFGLLYHWPVSAGGRDQLCLAVVVEEERAGPKKEKLEKLVKSGNFIIFGTLNTLKLHYEKVSMRAHT